MGTLHVYKYIKILLYISVVNNSQYINTFKDISFVTDSPNTITERMCTNKKQKPLALHEIIVNNNAKY